MIIHLDLIWAYFHAFCFSFLLLFWHSDLLVWFEDILIFSLSVFLIRLQAAKNQHQQAVCNKAATLKVGNTLKTQTLDQMKVRAVWNVRLNVFLTLTKSASSRE